MLRDEICPCNLPEPAVVNLGMTFYPMSVLNQDKYQKSAVILLLVVAAFAAFAQVLDCGFINFDDPGYVTNNVHIRDGLSPKAILWSFTSTAQSNWHPLTWISHALDCSLFGLNPAFHHAMSLCLHLLSSIVLFLVLDRVTRARWQSAFVALVFAIHPLHVESVAWISERKDVLSGLFWMLTIGAYARYRRSPGAGSYLLTLGTFAAGLLAKPMMVTLPFVLILLDYWPFRIIQPASTSSVSGKATLRRQLQQSVYEKIPFFVLSLGSSVVTYMVQRQGGSMASSDALAFSDRAANALTSYGTYIWKSLVPTDLAIFYPYPDAGVPMRELVLAVVVLAVLTIIVWRERVRAPYLIVGWLWFLGTLVPVIGLVQVGLQAMADRYMYLPIIGLSIMAAWGVPALVRQVKIYPQIPGAAFTLIVVGMILGTRAQVPYWRDSSTLFEHAVEVTSGNHLALNNLGAALADSGNHEGAVRRIREALRLRPDEILIHKNLARSLAALGEFPEALEQYTWILTHDPSDPVLQARAADILADLGKTNEAVGHYLEAIRLDPADAFSHCRLGELYAQEGKFEEARNECGIALKLKQTNSKAHDVLGIIAGKQGKLDEAVKEFLEAIRCDSSNADAYNDFGILYNRMGNGDEAMRMYESAVRVNPLLRNAHFNLGSALASRGRFAEAETHWLRAVELNPAASADARVNLGKLYSMQGKSSEAIRQLKEALRIDPNNSQAHYAIGNVLVRQGNLAEAEVHYTEVLRLAPSFKAAQTALEKLRTMQNH